MEWWISEVIVYKIAILHKIIVKQPTGIVSMTNNLLLDNNNILWIKELPKTDFNIITWKRGGCLRL